MSASNEVKEFYSNDVVYRFDKRKKIVFGVVVDSYESSDSDESHALQKGQIRVFWLNNSTEQVWKQNKVKLMSRSVIPGDIVRRLEQGKETQRGYCRMAKQYASVQIVGTDKVIENVSQDRLVNVLHFDYGTPICLKTKFGRIQNFEQKITMASKCGSIVEILHSINSDIEDFWLTKRNRSFIDEYHPGQEVTAIASSFEQPNWIKKSKSMKRNLHTRQRFTVQKVEISNVEVAWHHGDIEGEVSVICDIKDEDIDKLKLLESVEDSFLELAERRLLKLSSSDIFIKKRDWLLKQSALCRPEIQKVLHVVNRNNKRSSTRFRTLISNTSFETITSTKNEKNHEIEDDDEEWSTEGEDGDDVSDNGSSCSNTSICNVKKKSYPPKAKELMPGHTLPVEVLCMDSRATIVWQDGTEEKDVPTTQLYYSISLDDHEFFPGEWVIANDKSQANRYGSVQKVDYLERTATIKWFCYSTNDKVPVLDCTNEMSVYDISKHPSYAFRPGSIVYAKPVHEDRLGTVIDSCPQGYVVVKWLSGEEENCWPQDIELLPESIDFVEDTEDDDEADMSCVQVSWETESIESIPGDISYEPTLQNMAARLDFVRSRIVYLKEAFRQHTITENFAYLRDLLMVYDNSSYLDKLLDTSFFSLKSKHYQALLTQVREKAKQCGVEIRGRLFSTDNQSNNKVKMAERENINKVLKLEHKINAQIESSKDTKETGEPSTPVTPDTDLILLPPENLCIEILSMLKARMDLAYAEIIARIGGTQALSVMTKASEQQIVTPTSSTPVPSFPTTPDDSFTSLTATPPKFTLAKSVITFDNEPYSIIDEADAAHRFFSIKVEPTDKQRFLKSVQKESKLLRESMPPGVWVRSYSNRLDLLSVMIAGPKKTPYEDGLFLFDIQLSADYPRSPPVVSYISYSSERLNPNLYVEGRVCISLLGTWLGRGTEVWGPNSTMLQLIVSIQGLILVAEPYYNEAGYEKQCESQQGYENSRTYNELVILKLVQSMSEMLVNPPSVFKVEVLAFFVENGGKMCERLKQLINDTNPPKPEFPLLPVSKGLKLSLNSSLDKFQSVLKSVIGRNSIVERNPIITSEF